MSVTHRSISVAIESSFGSLSASTGLPDNSSLTYVSIPCERDPIIIYGDVVASERNDARDGTYSLPPEPDTVYSSGSRVRRRTGQVSIRLDLTTIGASGTNYDAGGGYLGALLGAGFQSSIPSAGSDSITAITSFNRFTTSRGNKTYICPCVSTYNISYF